MWNLKEEAEATRSLRNFNILIKMLFPRLFNLQLKGLVQVIYKLNATKI